MGRLRSIHYRFYKLRAKYRKRRRLLFPSPAEVELIRIMGGKYVTLSWFKDVKTGFPLTFVTDLGTFFKREAIEREVRVGAMYIDFATVGLIYRKGIEVDGLLYHMDIVKEQNREDYVREHGYSLLHIRAAEIYRSPHLVQQRILKYLAS
jgi:hypothetical protein